MCTMRSIGNTMQNLDLSSSSKENIASPLNTPTKDTNKRSRRPFTPKFELSSSSDSVSNILKGMELFNEYHYCSPEAKATKTVSFAPTVHVILVPTKEEYYEAQIAHRVWYNQKELAKIEKEAILSISLGSYYKNRKDEEEDEEYGDCSQIFPLSL